MLCKKLAWKYQRLNRPNVGDRTIHSFIFPTIKILFVLVNGNLEDKSVNTKRQATYDTENINIEVDGLFKESDVIKRNAEAQADEVSSPHSEDVAASSRIVAAPAPDVAAAAPDVAAAAPEVAAATPTVAAPAPQVAVPKPVVVEPVKTLLLKDAAIKTNLKLKELRANAIEHQAKIAKLVTTAIDDAKSKIVGSELLKPLDIDAIVGSPLKDIVNNKIVLNAKAKTVAAFDNLKAINANFKAKNIAFRKSIEAQMKPVRGQINAWQISVYMQILLTK